MQFVTNYRFKPHMAEEETRELLELFQAVGEAPGATAHYVWTDGRGGTVIGESDDIEAMYRNLLNYTRFMEFDTKVVLPAERAVVHTLDFLG